MSTVVINGTVITGEDIYVKNGRVLVDGSDVTPDSKVISISVTGSVGRIEADTCSTIEVSGSVGNVSTLSGAVRVGGDIAGSVQTTSGAVDCNGNIGGSVSTLSGSIRHR